jgi:hypothetical protein
MSPMERYKQNYRRHLWDTYGPDFKIPKKGDLIKFRTDFYTRDSAFDHAIVTDVNLPTIYFVLPDRGPMSTGVASVRVISRPPPGPEVNYR